MLTLHPNQLARRGAADLLSVQNPRYSPLMILRVVELRSPQLRRDLAWWQRSCNHRAFEASQRLRLQRITFAAVSALSYRRKMDAPTPSERGLMPIRPGIQLFPSVVSLIIGFISRPVFTRPICFPAVIPEPPSCSYTAAPTRWPLRRPWRRSLSETTVNPSVSQKPAVDERCPKFADDQVSRPVRQRQRKAHSGLPHLQRPDSHPALGMEPWREQRLQSGQSVPLHKSVEVLGRVSGIGGHERHIWLTVL